MPTQITGVSANLGSEAGYLGMDSAPVSGRPMSLAAWVYITSTTIQNMIINLAVAAGSINPWIILSVSNSPAGELRVYTRDASGNSTSGSSTGYTVGTGAWHHVAMTWASGGTVTLYIDGVACGSFASTRDTSGCGYTAVGGNALTPEPDFNGYISPPAIWNVAITAAVVAALAGDGETLGVNPRSLETPPIWYVEDLRQGDEGAGPHEPVIGSGALVNVGTISAAPSDPPMAQYEASAGGVLVPSRRVVLATPMDVCMNPVM